MSPEYDDDGNQLSPSEVAERNKKRGQEQREQQESEALERLQILRTNKEVADKLDGLQERLDLNDGLDRKFQRDENSYLTLKEKTAEYQKALAELQVAVRNRSPNNVGGNEAEILELLASLLDLEEKLKETERERAKALEEYGFQKKKREIEKARHLEQVRNLRKWGDGLSEELKKRQMTKSEFEDDRVRTEKSKRGEK